MSNRYALLSFDVEEFDMPLEYGCRINETAQMEVGKKGLDAIVPVLEAHDLTTTLFTTASFAMQYPDDIRRLAQTHEIASHTLYHSAFVNAHLLQSKQILEKISGKTVTGLRMPRMRKVSVEEVKKAGYTYDSSVNPTWLPGRYNNFRLPRTVYTEEGLTRMPASVSPLLRVPLFWLSFKNLPYPLFKMFLQQTLAKDGYACLYFHPWEFTDIRGYGLPGYTRKLCGEPLLNRLHHLIRDLKKDAECITIETYLQQKRS
ncbi:MAG: polysaccharide deacetylase family protein [Sediminibacterium sp.]